MNYKQEFATVNLILKTKCETRGVDAFILSMIKAEKQMRRIFTFLVFQNPVYNFSHYLQLREALASNRKIYFKGFIKGINLILSQELKEIYGDNYNIHLNRLLEYYKDRNKIFHGQITQTGLTREDLIERVNYIQSWCENLAKKINKEIGYDGFSDSYRKSSKALNIRNLESFDSVRKYIVFLENEIQG